MADNGAIYLELPDNGGIIRITESGDIYIELPDNGGTVHTGVRWYRSNPSTISRVLDALIGLPENGGTIHVTDIELPDHNASASKEGIV